MTYTLQGDRNVEYGFLAQHIPQASGGLALDLGCGPNASGAQIALSRGYSVIGIDLEPCGWVHPRLTFIQGDFLEYDFGPMRFNFIINVSSIEHFGLAGRYGVTVDNPHADIAAMRKLYDLLVPGGTMVLTLPVGIDEVFVPLHRVYGRDRLPNLTARWRVLPRGGEYFGKSNDVDEYIPIPVTEALDTKATITPPYYCIGGFHLCRVDDLLPDGSLNKEITE